jgi:hypothetical protein
MESREMGDFANQQLVGFAKVGLGTFTGSGASNRKALRKDVAYVG